ncbi:hypothetical protein V499_01688 [Pseudogymnoascus sp. VKM F-103]|nr:hypothetical protein V499_01688 [Pseudogymnoascus sp. VKM F-103]
MTDVAMSPNGLLSPQPQDDRSQSPLSTSAKRKRVNSNEESSIHVNGTTEPKTNGAPKTNSHEQIDDFITILKRFDTTPSILERPLSNREESKEPQAKRSKTDNANTIIARAAAHAYSSLNDVISDAKAASKSLTDELQLPNGSTRTHNTPLSIRESQLVTNINLFTKTAEDLAHRQKTQDELKSAKEEREQSPNISNYPTNGTSPKASTQISMTPGEHKLVLTLYGNAPGAKQLFSSLQETAKVPNGTIRVPQPLREVGLPNGINTTQIVPIDTSGAVDDKKQLQTLGDLFSTSTSTLPFLPPKPIRASSNKGLAIGWSQPSVSDIERARNNQSYYSQPISSGHWLEYTGSSNLPDPKRRQRERAMSLNGVKASTSEAETAEQEAAKLDALFRSAYSSFAPTKDDAAAVVPQGVVSKIWWQRVGEKTFQRLANNMETMALVGLDAQQSTSDNMAVDSVDDEDEKFKDAVDNWEEVIDPSLEDSTSDANDQSIEDKDVAEVLDGISDLLETLNSYQRNRNLSLSAVPRAGVMPGADIPSPAKPSEAEAATYSILKSQLTLMIATLPPYAVAKLNSDQLSDLSISTKVPVLTDTFKGVLEEDEYAARAKVAAMTAATTSRHTPSTSHHRSSSLYGNQYAAASARPSAPPAQYYNQSQTPNRAPSTNMVRPPSTVGPIPYAPPRTISGTKYRPQQAYGTPTYPHQVPRPGPPQQYPSGPQAYYQTPNAQKYAQPPQTAPQQRYQPPANAAYAAQRAQPPANGLAAYPYATPARQASPQKPQQGYTSHLPATAPRPFPASYYPNGGAPSTPQPQAAPLGPTGYHTVMTPAEQSSMMERQRAQLAQQQGVQAAARNVAQAGVNGGQANGGGGGM